MTNDHLKFRFSIDRGGTFTDIYCDIFDTTTQKVVKQRVVKLLSEDPNNYNDAPTEGIRRILEEETGRPHPRSQQVRTAQIDFIRMGTTVATNALLERKGERIALVTTSGFADLQFIGNQSRPKIFDLKITRPELLYEKVIEVNERVLLLKSDKEKEKYAADQIIIGRSQESVIVEKSIDEQEVTAKLQEIYNTGIRSIAVVFIHSYTFPNHELIVKKLAEKVGFEQISVSSEVMPMIRVIPRGGTTCVDAYLTPIIKRYLQSFTNGFDANIKNVNVLFMQSDGGLTPMDNFLGNRAILSGPAGGVVGYSMTSKIATHAPVIGFDMGGTSTDVSRFAGEFEHVFETTTAGITIQSPQLDINTVAAGGGSRLFYRNNLFVVGPESAGSNPGPICYRKNGYLAVTDANVLLGRIQPHLFPAIFGPQENDILDYQATYKAFEEITQVINENAVKTGSKLYSIDEVAYGFIRVANEAMARPIRNLTTMKGYDVTKHYLACFGGAGPQHCCAIAKTLGMRKVLVHKYSGILSAYGLSLADIVVERQEPFNSSELNASSLQYATDRLTTLENEAKKELIAQGFDENSIKIIHYLNCRYHGTDTSQMTCLPDHNPECYSYQDIFVQNYRREYGFELKDRMILIDDIRVRAIGKSDFHLMKGTGSSSSSDVPETQEEINKRLPKKNPTPSEYANVFFGTERMKTPIYFLNQLSAGDFVQGPAIIIQNVATVIVEPKCSALVTTLGDIEITIEELESKDISEDLDPIYLSVFAHRFMGIAEQMGRTLQRTSISVNIKERLDFSCALFDSFGGLVANAPHLPVHLGAMSEAVRYQIKYWGKNLSPGDVLVSNHPQLAGGSHLPDITVMTPIFHNGEIVFFVASRGHHADIGGIAPGSMPPLSKSLVDEGAAIVAFKLVEKGNFQEEGIVELLTAPGKIPGNFGTRKISDNLSDLKAQVAANTKGATLMGELINEYGLNVVKAYMGHIQACAEQAVRDMLR
jgi:5-oxoprolinase (ATP-hydrolysing)